MVACLTHHRRCRILAAMRGLVIAIVVAAAATAFAEPPDPTESSQIFQEARELAKAGKYDEACALFARSYGLDPAPGTAVNLADCLERQGHIRRAWALFDVVARDPQSGQLARASTGTARKRSSSPS